MVGGVTLFLSKKTPPLPGTYRLVADYASCHGLSKDATRRMCRNEELEAIKVGKWWLVWDEYH